MRSLFAIREKGTDRFLPDLPGRGYTHTEPTEGKMPRYFPAKRNARLALGAWLKGAATTDLATDWETAAVEDCGISYRPVPGRLADKMEIVEFNLIEVCRDD